MNLTPPKIRPLHIGISTAVLAVAIGGPAVYFGIMPVVKANTALAAQVASLQDQGSPANQAAADKALADAQKSAQATTNKWRILESRYCRIGPDNQILDETDPFKALEVLSEEQAGMTVKAIKRWVIATGNKPLALPSIASRGTDPNDIPTDIIKLPASGLKVQGTFQSVLHLLRSTSQCSRLITVDQVSLSSAQSGDSSTDTGVPSYFGSSDTVIADIDLTVYIYPRNGKQKPSVYLPSGSTSGGAAGSSGSLGGPAVGPAGPAAGPAGPAGGPPIPGAAGSAGKS